MYLPLLIALFFFLVIMFRVLEGEIDFFFFFFHGVQDLRKSSCREHEIPWDTPGQLWKTLWRATISVPRHKIVVGLKKKKKKGDINLMLNPYSFTTVDC